jgi:hypothetical protein
MHILCPFDWLVAVGFFRQATGVADAFAVRPASGCFGLRRCEVLTIGLSVEFIDPNAAGRHSTSLARRVYLVTESQCSRLPKFFYSELGDNQTARWGVQELRRDLTMEVGIALDGTPTPKITPGSSLFVIYKSLQGEGANVLPFS